MGKRNVLNVTARLGHDGAIITAMGRDAWALLELLKAGEMGCTPIDHPGPRWSAYVFNLRQMGLVIETVHENHKGDFAGTHARYVLRSPIEIVAQSDLARMREAA